MRSGTNAFTTMAIRMALAAAPIMALAPQAQAADLTAHAKAGHAFSSSLGEDKYGPATGNASAVQAAYAGETFGSPTNSDASAFLDLSAGTLGVSASVSNYGTASSEARFVEHLTFSVAGAGADDLTPITVLLNWQGDLDGGAWSDFGFSLNRGVTNAALQFDAKNTNGSMTYNTQIIGDWASSAVSGAGTGNQLFTLTFNLKGASSVIELASSVRETAYLTADLNAHARMNLILPDNVSFTSTSGVFLSQAASIGAVPEPAAWSLMLTGFGAIGGMMRYRRKGAASFA